MDEKSLEILQYPAIKKILSGYATFPVSKELILNLEPITDYDGISRLLRQSEEARHLLSIGHDYDIGGASDIRGDIKLAAQGKILDPINLIEIRNTLSTMRQVRNSLNEVSGETPLLWGIAQGIADLPSLEKEISLCLSNYGELLDSASPELAAVRSQIRDTRELLVQRLEDTMRTPRGRRIVQEPVITERNGRYVIPVKAEFRKEIKGITHDVSNTGASVYIEPWSMVNLGNTFRELQTAEKREIERILKNLSMAVGAKEEEILRNISLVAELDVIIAKARYARSVKAAEPGLINHSDEPEQGASGYYCKLVDARHPLLGGKAVPLSLEIGRDFSILFITGPNTGGKTVALKTIGLLCLMVQSGIPIPASRETQIPIFDGIFADIGDEQSIEQTLSSFSWHVGNIVRIIKNATERSLVLLDELGASTDPAEGSALARAILLHFLSSKTLTAATTHYADLKAFAHITPGLQNASFDFDPVTLEPTYHMTVGIPGGSNAMAVAARLGVPPEIIDKASTMLTQSTLDLESMLSDIAAEKIKISEMRKSLEKTKNEAEASSTEVENRLVELRREKQKIVREGRDKVTLEIAELQRQIRQANLDLRKERSKSTIDAAKKSLADIKARINNEALALEVTEPSGQESITVGDSVYISEFDLYGTVLSISEEAGETEIQAGQVTLKVKLNSIEKTKQGVTERQGSKSKVLITASRQTPSNLDLRGKRADDVEAMLDSYLSGAVIANLGEVQIIHGIGTGTVRHIVRDLLTIHPLVKSFRSGRREEGGDGVTVASLQ
ncbi:endonuclease MutS2 [Chloroflexota bacterium]